MSGGVGEDGTMSEEVHLLSLPSQSWSTLHLPLLPPPSSPALSTLPLLRVDEMLGRRNHGLTTLSSCDGGHVAIVFGGYAGKVAKFGVSAVGGFASNQPVFLHHSTAAALQSGSRVLEEHATRRGQARPSSADDPALAALAGSAAQAEAAAEGGQRGGSPEETDEAGMTARTPEGEGEEEEGEEEGEEEEEDVWGEYERAFGALGLDLDLLEAEGLEGGGEEEETADGAKERRRTVCMHARTHACIHACAHVCVHASAEHRSGGARCAA